MADNGTVTGTTGLAIASDDIAGVYYQKIKVSHGPADSATDVSTAAPFPITLLSTAATYITTAVPLGVKIGDGTTNLSIDVGGASRASLYSTNATAISSSNPIGVKMSDGTTNRAIDVGGAARTTLYTTSATAVTFNTNGRATPGNSAPVVLASQKAQAVSSSTGTALTGGSGGAVGDWLDGFLVTPTSTATGAIVVTDGTTGTANTVVSGGTPNLVPFWIPYPATSQSSAWIVRVGVNQTITAFGNFT